MSRITELVGSVLDDEAAAERKRREDEMNVAAEQIRGLFRHRDDLDHRNKAEAESQAKDAKRLVELERDLMNLNVTRANELLALRAKIECAACPCSTQTLDGQLLALQRQFPALYSSIVDERAQAAMPAPAVAVAGGKAKR